MSQHFVVLHNTNGVSVAVLDSKLDYTKPLPTFIEVKHWFFLDFDKAPNVNLVNAKEVGVLLGKDSTESMLVNLSTCQVVYDAPVNIVKAVQMKLSGIILPPQEDHKIFMG